MRESDIRPGIWRHFKGNLYRVIGVATYSEDPTTHFVVYRALYGEGVLWVRPASMWCETVVRDGMAHPRFTYLGEELPHEETENTEPYGSSPR